MSPCPNRYALFEAIDAYISSIDVPFDTFLAACAWNSPTRSQRWSRASFELCERSIPQGSLWPGRCGVLLIGMLGGIADGIVPRF